MIGVISAQLPGEVINVMKKCGNDNDPPTRDGEINMSMH
jgi:hypothetical protein